MAIEVSLTGKCKGCPAVSVTMAYMYADNGVEMISAKCDHQNVCDLIEKHLQSSYNTYDQLWRAK